MVETQCSDRIVSLLFGDDKNDMGSCVAHGKLPRHLPTVNSGPARGGPHHVDPLLINPAIAEGQVIAGLDTADVINQVTGQLCPVPLGGVVLVG